MTSGCWRLYVGDSFWISVMEFRYWWRKRPKSSPTPQSCRQHISSSTSVTNIDVAYGPRRQSNRGQSTLVQWTLSPWAPETSLEHFWKILKRQMLVLTKIVHILYGFLYCWNGCLKWIRQCKSMELLSCLIWLHFHILILDGLWLTLELFKKELLLYKMQFQCALRNG